MTITSTAIALISVLVLGYLLAVSIGTWAYFANETDKRKSSEAKN
ncbi:endonuclease [Myxosarcina sp. GI1(2024)]